MKKNKIIHGHCLKVMKRIPNNYVDSIITDPPYGLGFMGKGWDTFDPKYIRDHPVTGKSKKVSKSPSKIAGSYDHSRNHEFQAWCTVWAKECLRVAKPGAILMAFGGTRTFHRLACAIEDAGWEIRDCIQWIYGSGFPKSLDVSKALDERHFKKWLKANPKQAKKYREQLAQAKESGNDAMQDVIYKYKRIAGAEREVVGKSSDPRYEYQHKENKGKFVNTRDAKDIKIQMGQITAPATPLAKLWDGWGTALKPSWEPILVAIKPLNGTYAANAEKWGVAGLNIDGGRISGEPIPINKLKNWSGFGQEVKPEYETQINTKGRFPSNTILSCTCDGPHEPDCPVRMLDEQSGILTTGAMNGVYRNTLMKNNPGTRNGQDIHLKQKANSGGASRFFYCAKSSRAERNAGCEGMEAKAVEGMGGNEYLGITSAGNRSATTKNHHPTVKPLALIEYLCRLTKTPTGGIVLDPFAGSGTTGLACLNTQRKFILIEKKLKYIKIAKARIRGRKRKRRLFDE